jgi:hypothetical protein
MTKIVAREIPPRSAWALEQAGVHPLLARLYAARGVLSREELDDGLALLLPPDTLRGAQESAVLLADAIRDDRRPWRRRRLRLRRRHGLRGSRARPSAAGREARRLPRA